MDDNSKIMEDNGYSEGSIPLRDEASPAISTVKTTGVNQIDSLLSGVKWSSNNVTFSFPTSKTDYTGYASGNEPDLNFVALNAMQKNAARAALAQWASVCNLNFTETTGGTGEIRFGTSSDPSTSWAYYPSTSDIGGDVWFGNSNYNSPTYPISGTYDYQSYLHEIGHALGLKHPHDTNGSGVVANMLTDDMEYSIMSYKSFWGSNVNDGYTNGYNSFATSPMMNDIAAVQYMYGANYTYNSGDTVYKFDPNQSKIFQTIWDGGGNDTYDLSAYTTNLKIDLRPGGWSTFDTKQLADLSDDFWFADGNVANALLYNGDTRSLIENAIGGSGNDNLIGNQADNMLNGGLGADTLVGGLGNDTYVVDNVGDVVVENLGEGIDTVQSSITYTLGANVENLTLTGVTNSNGYGNELNNVITGNSGNNILDGGLGADTMIGGAGNDLYAVENNGDVVVENAGEGTDTVYSFLGSYTLGANVENLILAGTANMNGYGNELNNVITGNSGNNILDGGLGADTMIGGAGNDLYAVENVGDIVVENAGEGTDTVYSFLGSYTLGANVENLILTGTANMNGTGNELSNVITGNSGINILDGGLGADRLVGGMGNDTYVVDNVGDVVVENIGEGIDTVQSSVTYTLGANVENLTLTGVTNSNGYGNELNNVITGNSGNNILDGGLGADTMIGGLGNDLYAVENVGDVVVENAGEGTDTVYSFLGSYTLGANVENLILTGTANMNGYGNELNNVITGNSGNNILDGGLGADTMIGGAGNDLYAVENVGDIVVENAGEGTDTVYSFLGSYTLGANVENLILTGTANMNGTGNELSNVITGNSGNNILDGGLGADRLVGGMGNDTYVVDNVGDVVVENIDEGIDTVQSSITYTLGANVENLTLTGVTNSNGYGNELNNVITGNSGNNILDGGLGADTMIGGLGNDLYAVENVGDIVVENAGEGIDTVYSFLDSYTLGANVENLILTGTTNMNGTGNELDNVITANSGNDNLYGGAGNDILYAGAGNDLLDGGLGNDTYVIGIGSGNDIINSYVGSTNDNGFDTLQFQNIALSGMSFTKNGNDLICTINQTGKTIDVSNWLLGTNYQVDQFKFADGTLTATQISQKIA